MAYTKPKQITGQMPQHCCDDDRQWINEKLLYCNNPIERRKVCEAYSKVYLEVFNSEQNEIKKEGRARFEANCRLRIYIAKKFRVFN